MEALQGIQSLANMLRIYAEHYVQIGQAIEQLAPVTRGVNLEVYPPPRLDQDQLSWVTNSLASIRTHCEQIELAVSSEFISHYLGLFLGSTPPPTFQLVQCCIDGFKVTFNAELKERMFLFVPPNDAYLYEQDALFGDVVNEAFPSAAKDIRSAGTCLSLQSSTASVFHSMRALEPGLRTLAEAMALTFTTEQWKVIIDEIEKKIRVMEQTPKSDQKIADLEFYSTAAKEFRYFKDAWRNHVMHARGTYDDLDALKILHHVGDFLKHLTTRLKEKL